MRAMRMREKKGIDAIREGAVDKDEESDRVCHYGTG